MSVALDLDALAREIGNAARHKVLDHGNRSAPALTYCAGCRAEAAARSVLARAVESEREACARLVCVYCEKGWNIAENTTDTRGLVHTGWWDGEYCEPVCKATLLRARGAKPGEGEK